VTLCNAGLMALAGRHALALLARIGNDNAAGEYYLPDAVALAVADGLPVTVVPVDEAEAQGVNDRVQLSVAEAAIQAQLRRSAMLGGATLIAPETVFLSHDTVLGRDVIVEPHVVFGPGVRVAEGCTVRAFAHLTETSLEAGVKVGPFVRLRGHAVLEAGAEVVEAKVRSNLQAAIGSGTKEPSRSTGQLLSALGTSPALQDRNGDFNVKVGFSEPRTDGDSNAKIASVLEYGKSGQPAKPFLKPAKTATRKACVDAMRERFEREVDRL